MDRISHILKNIMLGILLAIMAMALALVVREGLISHSYLIALIAGVLWVGALFLLLRLLDKKLEKPLLSTLAPAKVILIISAFSLLVNLLWVIIIRIEPFSDYLNFWQCACELAAGERPGDTAFIAMYPHIMGTASFLSVFVFLFGESVFMVTLINVLLTVVSGIIIFYICLEFSGLETASIAALFWAVCPSKLMLNSLVFSEPLYTCMILLFMLMMLRLHRDLSAGFMELWQCMVVGALLGFLLQCINIVRPIAGILLIALFIWLILLRGEELKKLSLWKSWLFVIAPLLFIYFNAGTLWTNHVAAVLGMEPAAVPIYNIYVGFNEATRGQWSPEDMELLFSCMNQPGVTPSQAQEMLIPLLKERISSGIDYPALFSSKLMAFMGNDELGGYTYRFTRGELFVKLCMVICNVFYYGVLLLSLRGLAGMFRRRINTPLLLLPLYVLGLTLAHMLVEVSSRYHYSMIPIIIIFAALGLARGENNKRSQI